jgi:hypothetical protein
MSRTTWKKDKPGIEVAKLDIPHTNTVFCVFILLLVFLPILARQSYTTYSILFYIHIILPPYPILLLYHTPQIAYQYYLIPYSTTIYNYIYICTYHYSTYHIPYTYCILPTYIPYFTPISTIP